MNIAEQIQLIQDVINRLNFEVIIPFEMYYKKQNTGFHIILRYIFPVVEYLSDITEASKYEMTSNLGLCYPRIIWKLYRNSIMHGDIIMPLGLKGSPYDHLAIGWSFGYSGAEAHSYVKDQFIIKVNIEKLIYDLRQYCEELIVKIRSEEISLKSLKANIVSIKNKAPEKELIKEFESIHQLYS